MLPEEGIFFCEPSRLQIFVAALNKINMGSSGLPEAPDKKQFMIKLIGVAIYRIANHPEEFDKKCLMNISAIGDKFIDSVRDLDINNGDLEYLFAYCYRFLIEYQLSSKRDVPPDMLEVLSRVSDFEYQSAASQIRYASHQMLINVVQHYIFHPDLATLKDLPNAINRANHAHEQSESELAGREVRVQALADKLKEYETEFNFVGLYSGFQSMKKTKDSEKLLNFSFLVFLGVLMTTPFLYKFGVVMLNVPTPSFDWSGAVTLIGLELLFIYFFRVALHNFRSIKAQIIQIELRMTLCQFIQSYAEYAKDTKGPSGLLERFEQIVFSGIVNNESAIPSSFDGLEQVAGLIDRLKK